MSETNTNESKTPSAVKDFGVAEDRNKKKRRKMEDAHTLIDSFGDDENSAFFAVYDGHSGKDAAKFCSEHLHKVLLEKLNELDSDLSDSNIEKAFSETFIETNKKLDESEVPKHQGCTAVSCLIRGSGDTRKVYAANAGDARAVLCRDGKAIRLTYDHKASDEAEAKRITDNGGFIKDNRVAGQIEVTRSIGDQFMKKYLISTPYTTSTALTEKDSHLIICCDGVFDVMSDQDVVDAILDEKRADLNCENLSKLLVALALSKDSGDNLTAMVIKL